ncbi:unnamed protein product [Protopolystoma xenopodis]|uniref:TRAF-type domain-containing protein n=1 Tax=Protopolystoma xenopodis TaxID=117903 RepID=A0A448WS17_9PLAT|nr:unnamed protein product [Protopolystoma xenopodis]
MAFVTPFSYRTTQKCPIDQNPLTREQVSLDKAFQKRIDSLGVRCSLQSSGCHWTGVLSELVVHLEDCEYRILQCPNGCGVKFEVRRRRNPILSRPSRKGLSADWKRPRG